MTPAPAQPAPGRRRAVFLDALGTLVELEPPWVHLRGDVPESVTDDALMLAVRKEMAYYKDHAHEGRDAETLAELRERCARLISDELGAALSPEQLVDAVRLRAYPDAAPALERLREEGMRLVVVSNWDCSLAAALARCGLADLIDGAVSSAEAGSRKPDPAIFAVALELAGCERREAIHVGDTVEEDLAAAEAAGIDALLIDRENGGSGDLPGGAGRIVSLEEIVDLL